MTSPRLSTDGTISVIERALEILYRETRCEEVPEELWRDRVAIAEAARASWTAWRDWQQRHDARVMQQKGPYT